MAVDGVVTQMVRLSLSPAEREHLAAQGVVADERGVLRTASGAEVAPGIAAAVLAKSAVAGYPDVTVTPGRVPDPARFDRPYLREGHAAENATAWTVNVPPRGAVGVIEREGAESVDVGKKARGKRARREQREARRAKSGREAEQAAFDAGPRTHTETVKAIDPGEFQRGFLAYGHHAQSSAVTGIRAAASLPPSNAGVLEPQHVDRAWLQQGHQEPSPGDQGDNNPVPPGGPGWAVYAAGEAAYRDNQAAVATHHVQQSAAISSEPAVARWEPSPALGAANMPHVVSTSGLPVGCAPGE